MADKQVVVKQDEEKPVPEEILAAAIVNLSKGFQRAMEAGLTRSAITLLVRDMLPSPMSNQPSRAQIDMVLRALPRLAETYISNVPKK